jgi:hypothetical protein
VELSLHGEVGRDIDPTAIDCGGGANDLGVATTDAVFMTRQRLGGCKLGLTLGGLSMVGVLGTPRTSPATPPKGSEKLRWKLSLRASRLCWAVTWFGLPLLDATDLEAAAEVNMLVWRSGMKSSSRVVVKGRLLLFLIFERFNGAGGRHTLTDI